MTVSRVNLHDEPEYVKYLRAWIRSYYVHSPPNYNFLSRGEIQEAIDELILIAAPMKLRGETGIYMHFMNSTLVELQTVLRNRDLDSGQDQ